MRTQRGRFRPLFLFLGVAAGLAAVASRWTDAVAVRGSSMAPTLEPGDLLLVERWTFTRRAPRAGDIALARDPRDGGRELIKRVSAVHDGRVKLRGDAARSTDSRAFGDLPQTAVEWRVAFRYWPLARLGPIPAAPLALTVEAQGGEPACSAFGDLVVGSADE
jgi:nickel-type superoxide dismutase maturation protease